MESLPTGDVEEREDSSGGLPRVRVYIATETAEDKTSLGCCITEHHREQVFMAAIAHDLSGFTTMHYIPAWGVFLVSAPLTVN